MIEIEDAGQRLDAEWPSVEPLDPIPERLLPDRHLGIHLAAKTVGPRIKRPVGDRGLLRKVERRADAEVGSAAAVDEMMHHPRAAVASGLLPVVLEVMGIA